MTDSLRKQIMVILHAKFTAMESEVNGYNTTWHRVLRGPIPSDENIDRNCLGIYSEDEENEDDGFGYTNKYLTVIVEFAASHRVGSEPEDILNDMLFDIEKTMATDPNLTTLTCDVKLTHSERFVDVEARESIGYAYFRVHYRHSNTDSSVNV